MDDKDFIRDYLDQRYKRLSNIPKYVGEVAGTNPDNILLIATNNHLTCSKFGCVYDSFDPRNYVAEYCWVVK